MSTFGLRLIYVLRRMSIQRRTEPLVHFLRTCGRVPKCSKWSKWLWKTVSSRWNSKHLYAISFPGHRDKKENQLKSNKLLNGHHVCWCWQFGPLYCPLQELLCKRSCQSKRRMEARRVVTQITFGMNGRKTKQKIEQKWAYKQPWNKNEMSYTSSFIMGGQAWRRSMSSWKSSHFCAPSSSSRKRAYRFSSFSTSSVWTWEEGWA